MTAEEIGPIARELDEVNRGRWAGLYIELQDGGEHVFVSVDVDPAMAQRAIEDIRADIRKILKAHVPMRRSQYSWMGVIKKNGRVFESLMGGWIDGPEI